MDVKKDILSEKDYRQNDGFASIGLIVYMIGLMLIQWQPVDVCRWIAASGALIVMVARLFSKYTGPDVKLKRLVRIQSMSGLFFCAACAFLFFPGGSLRDFIAFTLAGAAIQIYTSIAIPRGFKKLQNG